MSFALPSDASIAMSLNVPDMTNATTASQGAPVTRESSLGSLLSTFGADPVTALSLGRPTINTSVAAAAVASSMMHSPYLTQDAFVPGASGYSYASAPQSTTSTGTCECPTCLAALASSSMFSYSEPTTPATPYDGTPYADTFAMSGSNAFMSYDPAALLAAATATNAVNALAATQNGVMNMNLAMGTQNSAVAHSVSTHGGHRRHSDSEMDFDQFIGRLVPFAMTAEGSTYLYNTLRNTRLQPQQFLTLVQEVQPRLKELLYDAYGLQVVTAMLSAMTQWTEFQMMAAEILTDRMLVFSLLCNCWKIVSLLMTHLGSQLCQPFVEVVMSHPFEISVTQQGCVSVQRVLDVTDPQQTAAICSAVVPFAPQLACHMYGNYVVQCILDKGGVSTSTAVVEACVAPLLVEMACNKFASNVIEKCLASCTPASRDVLLQRIYECGGVLEVLVNDQFGNFVVQASIMAISDEATLTKVKDRLKPLMACSPYGTKIDYKLKKKLMANRKGSTHNMEGGERHMSHGGSHGGKPRKHAHNGAPLAALSVNTNQM